MNTDHLISMKPSVLQNIILQLGLKNCVVEYSDKPMVWLELKASTAFFRTLIKLFSYALKIFPFKNRLLSPYIMLYAEK
jgi:hypothetical protein